MLNDLPDQTVMNTISSLLDSIPSDDRLNRRRLVTGCILVRSHVDEYRNENNQIRKQLLGYSTTILMIFLRSGFNIGNDFEYFCEDLVDYVFDELDMDMEGTPQMDLPLFTGNDIQTELTAHLAENYAKKIMTSH